VYRRTFRPHLLKLCDQSLRATPVIFSINAGRTGSMYLQSLLATAEGAISLHEPCPQMNGECFHEVERKGFEATRADREVKVEQIKKQILRHRINHPFSDLVYCETSLMFLKSFYDVIVDHFHDVKIVRLHRDAADLVRSLHNAGLHIDQPAGRRWLAVRGSRNRVFPQLCESPEATSPLLRLVDYVVDFEARADQFCQEHPNIPVHVAPLQRLNTPEGVKELFSKCGLKATEDTLRAVGVPVNTTEERPHTTERMVTKDECKNAVMAFREIAENLGIPLPKTPTFDGYW
jgi:hypothetical protein